MNAYIMNIMPTHDHENNNKKLKSKLQSLVNRSGSRIFLMLSPDSLKFHEMTLKLIHTHKETACCTLRYS